MVNLRGPNSPIQVKYKKTYNKKLDPGIPRVGFPIFTAFKSSRFASIFTTEFWRVIMSPLTPFTCCCIASSSACNDSTQTFSCCTSWSRLFSDALAADALAPAAPVGVPKHWWSGKLLLLLRLTAVSALRLRAPLAVLAPIYSCSTLMLATRLPHHLQERHQHSRRSVPPR